MRCSELLCSSSAVVSWKGKCFERSCDTRPKVCTSVLQICRYFAGVFSFVRSVPLPLTAIVSVFRSNALVLFSHPLRFSVPAFHLRQTRLGRLNFASFCAHIFVLIWLLLLSSRLFVRLFVCLFVCLCFSLSFCAFTSSFVHCKTAKALLCSALLTLTSMFVLYLLLNPVVVPCPRRSIYSTRGCWALQHGVWHPL